MKKERNFHYTLCVDFLIVMYVLWCMWLYCRWNTPVSIQPHVYIYVDNICEGGRGESWNERGVKRREMEWARSEEEIMEWKGCKYAEAEKNHGRSPWHLPPSNKENAHGAQGRGKKKEKTNSTIRKSKKKEKKIKKKFLSDTIIRISCTKNSSTGRWRWA